MMKILKIYMYNLIGAIQQLLKKILPIYIASNETA